jgi:hypothetical protein
MSSGAGRFKPGREGHCSIPGMTAVVALRRGLVGVLVMEFCTSGSKRLVKGWVTGSH